MLRQDKTLGGLVERRHFQARVPPTCKQGRRTKLSCICNCICIFIRIRICICICVCICIVIVFVFVSVFVSLFCLYLCLCLHSYVTDISWRQCQAKVPHTLEESFWANESLCVLAKKRRLCGTNWDIICQVKSVSRGVSCALRWLKKQICCANYCLCVLAKESRLCWTNWDIMCQVKSVSRGTPACNVGWERLLSLLSSFNSWIFSAMPLGDALYIFPAHLHFLCPYFNRNPGPGCQWLYRFWNKQNEEIQ